MEIEGDRRRSHLLGIPQLAPCRERLRRLGLRVLPSALRLPRRPLELLAECGFACCRGRARRFVCTISLELLRGARGLRALW